MYSETFYSKDTTLKLGVCITNFVIINHCPDYMGAFFIVFRQKGHISIG